MKTLGKHLLIEITDCDKEIINDQDKVGAELLKAAELSGATIIKDVTHKFSPHGVSSVIVIAESHFSIHTWPEYGYCALDIFTCGESIDTAKAIEHVKTAFKASHASVMEIGRGALDIADLKYKPDAK